MKYCPDSSAKGSSDDVEHCRSAVQGHVVLECSARLNSEICLEFPAPVVSGHVCGDLFTSSSGFRNAADCPR